MILSLLIFFILLLLIYSLSRQLMSRLYHLLGLEFLSFFLLPGTVIHELSHMLVAEILFVKTGKLSFKPEVKEDNQIGIGQLEVTETDPFRRTLIGLAPLVAGLTIIGLGANFYLFPQLANLKIDSLRHWPIVQFLFLFAIGYLIFTLSTAMFSSPKDLEVAVIPALFFTIIILFLWLAGFKLTVPKNLTDWLGNLLANLNRALLIVVGLDLMALFILKGLNSLTRRLFRHD